MHIFCDRTVPQEVESPTFPSIRGVDGGAVGEYRPSGGGDGSNVLNSTAKRCDLGLSSSEGLCQGQDEAAGQSKDQWESAINGGREPSRGGGRLERSRDDQELQPDSRHPDPPGQDAQHGECLATDHPAHHREQGEMIMTPEWHHLHAGDIDAEVMLQSSEGPCQKSINPESVKFWKLVEAIESELSIRHHEKTIRR